MSDEPDIRVVMARLPPLMPEELLAALAVGRFFIRGSFSPEQLAMIDAIDVEITRAYLEGTR